jgi:hypothetical protein
MSLAKRALELPKNSKERKMIEEFIGGKTKDKKKTKK